jgi:predicted ATP-grasp superfamily ATP-dependent carboligase
MRGFCLLGTSSGVDPVDLRAATNLLEAIKDLFVLNVDIPLPEPEMDEAEEIPLEEIDMNYR